MGQRGPVSLAELVDKSVGIAGEIVSLLESDPPEIEAALEHAKLLRATLANRPIGRRWGPR